jgi:hypothetical protein
MVRLLSAAKDGKRLGKVDALRFASVLAVINASRSQGTVMLMEGKCFDIVSENLPKGVVQLSINSIATKHGEFPVGTILKRCNVKQPLASVKTLKGLFARNELIVWPSDLLCLYQPSNNSRSRKAPKVKSASKDGGSSKGSGTSSNKRSGGAAAGKGAKQPGKRKARS